MERWLGLPSHRVSFVRIPAAQALLAASIGRSKSLFLWAQTLGLDDFARLIFGVEEISRLRPVANRYEKFGWPSA